MLSYSRLFRLSSIKRVFFGSRRYRIEEVNLIFDSLDTALYYVSTELDQDVHWCIVRYNDHSLVARSSYDEVFG